MDLLTVGLAVCIIVIALWLLTGRPSRLPPGPPLIPFLGNVLSMDTDVRVSFRKFRKQYGDVFSIYMFHKPVIVLNGYDVLKEALVKKADFFSNRPPSFFTDHISRSKGIVSSAGTIWKEQRKFALSTLRDLGMGKSVLEDKIQEELVVFLKALEDEQGQPFNPAHLLQNSISNNICSIVLGKRFEYTDPKFQKFLKAIDENFTVGASGIMNTFPLLRFLPGDLFKFKRTLRNKHMINEEFIAPLVREHISSRDENMDDFTSAYIDEMKKENRGPSFDDENLKQSIIDLFVAGTETTSTALRWALVFFLNYPDVQEKCFQEIKENIGLNRPPSMRDKMNLPYLEATIHEILRRGDIAPTSVPHAASEDVELHGYVIPKGQMIIPFLDSVLQDPEIWGDPENFRPERFLNDDGKFKKEDRFVAFSLGRRVCLGESLARMELFLFLASMIQRFEFQVADGVKPSLDGIMGFTYFPKPFEVKARKRE